MSDEEDIILSALSDEDLVLANARRFVRWAERGNRRRH
jgi:hypothetical protein